MNIGQRIKAFMLEKELTVDDLVERTGLDRDFIIAMQEQDIYPSIGPLLKVARALGVRLGTFMDDHISEDPHVTRFNQFQEELITHRGANKPASLVFHSLAGGKSDRHMEPFYIDIHPESQVDKKLSSHEGEEFLVVIKGSVEIIYGAKNYILGPGDSIYYNSIVPHNVGCAGDEKASIHAVIYIPD